MASIFDGYPYSNTHQLNLDWIIAKIQEVGATLEEIRKIASDLENVDVVIDDVNKAVAEAKAAAEEAKNAASTVRTDTSLTEAGVAADAKAVGDLTINGKPLRTDPVLTAAELGAAALTNTVNGKQLGSNPVLTANDVGAASKTNTVNGKQLGSNPVITASDLGAASTSNTVNGKAIGNNPVLTAEDVGALTALSLPEYPGCYYRMVGEEQEWLNPPLEMGVEYRTSERYGVEPVYIQRFNCGACPVDGGRTYNHNIDYCNPLSITGVTTGTGYTLPFVSSASGNGILLSARTTGVDIYSQLSTSNHGDVVVVLKYTKIAE